MNGMVLVRSALLVTAVSLGMAACGDDASGPGSIGGGGDGGATPGSGGANHAGGSSSDAGEGGTSSGGQPGGEAGASNGGVSSGGMTGGEGGAVTVAGASAGGEGGAETASGGAAGSGGEGGASSVCGDLHSDYGTLSDLAGDVTVDGAGGVLYHATLPALPANPLLPDLIHVELYPGYGSFPNNLTTLTNHVLSGDDLNYGTCGVCVLAYSNVSDSGQGAAEKSYFLSGGTITLTSVAGRMTGTLKNATFVEVTIADQSFVTTPVPGGCTTSITSLPFDAAIP